MATLIHLCTTYGCLCTTVVELSDCDRGLMACKTKIFIIWPFMEKACQPLQLIILLDNTLLSKQAGKIPMIPDTWAESLGAAS